MKEEVKEGKIKVEGVNDVLTKARGKPEHGGRVRGQGTHVKQSVYFDLPREKKSRTMEERIREGVQKFMAEETPKIIKQRDAFWAGEMEKLRAELLTKAIQNDGSPKPNSEQASCQSKGGVDLDTGLKNLDTPETARNIFSSEQDRVFSKVKMIDNLYVDLGEDVKDDKNMAGDDVNGRSIFEKNTCEKLKVDACGSAVCQLAIGSLSNIVASAKIDEVCVLEGHEQTIHGVRLAEENARVSITEVIQGDAKIPFPVGDEIVTVQASHGIFYCMAEKPDSSSKQ